MSPRTQRIVTCVFGVLLALTCALFVASTALCMRATTVNVSIGADAGAVIVIWRTEQARGYSAPLTTYSSLRSGWRLSRQGSLWWSPTRERSEGHIFYFMPLWIPATVLLFSLMLVRLAGLRHAPVAAMVVRGRKPRESPAAANSR